MPTKPPAFAGVLSSGWSLGQVAGWLWEPFSLWPGRGEAQCDGRDRGGFGCRGVGHGRAVNDGVDNCDGGLERLSMAGFGPGAHGLGDDGGHWLCGGGVAGESDQAESAPEGSEQELGTVIGFADAVVGQGLAEGCSPQVPEQLDLVGDEVGWFVELEYGVDHEASGVEWVFGFNG